MRQGGFTLIELMIALALGLVISAAAIMLFMTGQRSLSMQDGAADLQDNANFGLNYIVKDIRLSNLNTTDAALTDRVQFGGIVLTSSANGFVDNKGTPDTSDDEILSNIHRDITGTNIAETFLSRSSGMTSGSGNAWTGVSNVQVSGADMPSDQLVIQYQPEYVRDIRSTGDLWFGGFDCEGNRIEFSVNDPRRVIVQRYFLRADANSLANEPNQALALACDAGWYNENATPTTMNTNISNGSVYGDAGQIIMKRVDHFRILLGVQNDTGYRYMSINGYMGLAQPRPRILSVQIAALVRSNQSVGNDGLIKDDQIFRMLDQNVVVKIPANTTPKYVRQVVSQTVALRNTFGDRGE